jgi:N-acetylglucosaminyldiphosphoundecaprenol N-acetyl-beta-D-mannosaminyltransferase
MNTPTVALKLMGIPIHDVTMDETLRWIARWIEAGTPHQVATVNPEFLMRAREHPDFHATLQRAALCIPDGIGILLAARLRGSPLRERVAGSDLVPRLAARAAARGWRVFFLGAAPGVAELASSRLKAQNPNLNVAGFYAGSPAPDEEAEIVARVREAQADIVLVAYGAPGQDIWLGRNLAATGAAVGIGVGGSFDFIAGVSRRAPRWIQSLGLEWFYRLLQEPWRWHRQLALPRFAWLVLTGRDAPEPSRST